jgi:hypothetical protein
MQVTDVNQGHPQKTQKPERIHAGKQINVLLKIIIMRCKRKIFYKCNGKSLFNFWPKFDLIMAKE